MRRAELLESKDIYKGKIVDLSVQRVKLPNGHVTEMELVRHPGASAVVPVDDAGHVLLIRHYRHATGGFLLEVPAGKLDPGESPERCAAREVQEETGFKVGSLQSLGWIWTTPGFTNEKIWLFLGRELSPATQQLQSDEVLTVERVPLDQAAAMAVRGEITDSKSICAILRAREFVASKQS